MANPIMGMIGKNSGAAPLNNNMLELIMAVKSNNPQQALNMLAARNPQLKQTMELIQGKTPRDMESVCRLLCSQRGINFDDLFAQVKQYMR